MHVLKIDFCSCHLVPACQDTPGGVTSLFVSSVNKWRTDGGWGGGAGRGPERSQPNINTTGGAAYCFVITVS